MILPDTLDSWFNFLARLHPVIVHLPIGILVLVVILEIFFFKQNMSSSPRQAIPFMLALGCIGAVLSCIAGWMLSKRGSYDAETLWLHQWLGIGVALVTAICWWIKKRRAKSTGAGNVYRGLMTVLFAGLLITGHNGGSMTHGEDYLSSALSEETKDTARFIPNPIADVQEAFVYADLVQNILGEKCYSCHSSKKVKGGLRVDEEKLLFKGGKHGKVIKPGNADESELVIRMLLPEGDDKRMPPKKQEPLTREEIALLKWWIQNGADTKKKTKEFSTTAEIMPILNSFAISAHEGSALISPLSAIFDLELPPPDQKVIDTLTNLGVFVSPVAKNKNLLEISCVNYPGFNDRTMPLLIKIAGHIVSLKLDGTQISDAAFNDVSQFSNLVRLNVAHTAVTGIALEKLKNLKGLEYVNIVNTKVDDQGLQQLRVLPALKKLYCWNSLVTKKGIEEFNTQKIIAVGGQ